MPKRKATSQLKNYRKSIGARAAKHNSLYKNRYIRGGKFSLTPKQYKYFASLSANRLYPRLRARFPNRRY